MKDFNVAICDDEKYYIDEFRKYIYAYESESEVKLHIIEYASGIELVEALSQNKYEYDMIFLDVEMPNINGIETAQRIREINDNVIICFITSYEDFALDAYKVDSIGYIIKPVEYSEVKKILNKAIIQINYFVDKEEAEKKYIEINTNREKKIVDINKIVYIEKRRNQCVFHMYDGEFVCYETLNDIFQKLDSSKFMYSHQGYIINFLRIKEVRQNQICFGDNVEVPVSRKYYKKIQQMHLDKINRLRNERI